MTQVSKSALEGLEKSIDRIEKEMDAIVKGDEDLRTNHKLVLSVPGIGPITALYLLCCTANFAGKPTGKQLSCYAGVAPFSERSGTSIRGRAKVHHMGNKELKKLLHMGAKSAVQNNAEARAYFERKKAEGKHDLSIINAVKSKMLLRVAAVVNNQKPYVDKTKIAA